ncbi:MAG: NADH-quinone oxidoreductase subunit N [Candidatus Omnitrophica bacterium]|nr:NADH-quinone oxidoreductase subunit N [Candidatus Omnitrophota bacterium]
MSLNDQLLFSLPLLLLTVVGLTVLLVGVVGQSKTLNSAFTLFGFLSAAVLVWQMARLLPPPVKTLSGETSFLPLPLFGGMLAFDAFALLFQGITMIIGLLVVLLSWNDQQLIGAHSGEYYALLCFASAGMMLAAAANHLLMLYLAIELISLSSYPLVGWLKGDARSAEAAMKYFLFGALASGLMLFGLSWLYGVTGAATFRDVLASLAVLPANHQWLVTMAIACIVAGLGFKISMAPFHLWTPDAYEGAPTPIATFLSVGPKAAGFAMILRFFDAALGPQLDAWHLALVGLAIFTMTLGNVAALVQTNIKRLLAYSTIAHAGYMLIGVAVATPLGQQAILLYLIVYTAMNVGTFAVVIAISNALGSESIDAYRGLAQRAPALAAMLAVCLLSLAGLPPMAGFLAKFLIFNAALASGGPSGVALAVAAAINSAIALYYYARIIQQAYLGAPASSQRLVVLPGLTVVSTVTAAAMLVIGLAPSPWLAWTSKAVLP